MRGNLSDLGFFPLLLRRLTFYEKVWSPSNRMETTINNGIFLRLTFQLTFTSAVQILLSFNRLSSTIIVPLHLLLIILFPGNHVRFNAKDLALLARCSSGCFDKEGKKMKICRVVRDEKLVKMRNKVKMTCTQSHWLSQSFRKKQVKMTCTENYFWLLCMLCAVVSLVSLLIYTSLFFFLRYLLDWH